MAQFSNAIFMAGFYGHAHAIERWRHEISAPLSAFADAGSDALARLDAWLWGLIHVKRRKVLDDPEMFATYHLLAKEAVGAVERHVAALRAQIARIIRDGVAAGAFSVDGSDAAADGVLDATVPFHHP